MEHVEENKQDRMNHHSQVTLSKSFTAITSEKGKRVMTCLQMCIPGITKTTYLSW